MSAYEQASVISAGEPMAVDPMVQAEMRQIAKEHLDQLGAQLAARRDRWVQARAASGVEKRWMEDIDQYMSRDAANKQNATMMDAAEAGYPIKTTDTKVQRSTVFVNITRPKTNAAEARLANMLFPVDDICWGLKPTPNPKLTQAALQEAQKQAQLVMQQQSQQQQPQQQQPQQGQPQQGQPGQMPQQSVIQLPPQQTASSQLAIAAQRAKGMQDEIHDALVECDYNAQGRQMLHDCAVIGTGIMKGPIVVNRISKAWRPMKDAQNTYVLELISEIRPASERVDPWNVFPDPACGEDVHNGSGIYERRVCTAKQIRELAKQQGYLKDQIKKVLEDGPQTPVVTNERDRKNNPDIGGEKHFEVWEYWGEFRPEDLRACGIDMPDGETEVVSGCIVFVNKTVIKGFVNPLETGDLPYDFMVWERADNSCWGYGIPFLCRPAQKVLNAAWRQMMDNAGLSVGPNVIVKPGIVQPADGNWQITGRKVWNCLDDSVDVRTAFDIFEIPNNTKEFEEIIELALKFADEESAVPKLAQGERGTAPETVGGMTLLMNSSNVVLSRMVKQFDDCITRPHIRRYYDFFMCYSDKEEIKGDFQVDARGSSELLVRDMQQQALLQFGGFAGNPAIAPMVNWEKYVKEVLKVQHIDPTEILKSDAEIEALKNQPPPPSPEEVKAETAMNVAKIRAQASMITAESREKGEIAFAQSQLQIAHDNQQMKMEELRLKRDLAILEYANSQKISLEQTKAQLAQTAMVETTKRQLAAAEMQASALETEKSRLHEQQMSQQQPAKE
jgi:hypothetical protein